MRITYIAQKLNMDGGGSNFSLELMSRMLSKQGHNITVITLNPEKNNYPDDLPFNVVGSKAKIGTRMGILENAHQVMSEYAADTDLFHIFSPKLLPAAGYFRNKNKAKPVVGRLNTYSMFCVNPNRMDGECHQNCTTRAKFAHQDASLSKRIAKIPFYLSKTFIEPELRRSLDAYFAISPAVKRIYSDVGLPAERISVVPNFYDPSFGPDKISVNSTNADGPLRLLYVGRIEPIKGLDCLINALARTSRIKLTIVGTGSTISDLRDLAESRGIRDRVSFEGRIPHDKLAPYYDQADLFVHPASWAEPFGRTLLESMQLGTPALVSDTGGPPWIVGDAGLTFPHGDAERLSEILSRIRDNPSKLTELSKACANRLERFNPSSVVSSIEQKYIHLSTHCSDGIKKRR
jgi:glycosyltransferase involved in cell wall biosynthesis